MNTNQISIRTIETEDKGFLSFFEANHDIPFEVKRVYYIYGVEQGVKRGGHAHKQLKQLLYCPSGKIEIYLDNGLEKEKVLLDSPSKGLVVSDLVWREMLWLETGSILVVAASDYYDECDYIRDYAKFLELVNIGE